MSDAAKMRNLLLERSALLAKDELLRGQNTVEGFAKLVADDPVLARQGNMLVSAFHPELTADDRVHRYFVEMSKKKN